MSLLQTCRACILVGVSCPSSLVLVCTACSRPGASQACSCVPCPQQVQHGQAPKPVYCAAAGSDRMMLVGVCGRPRHPQTWLAQPASLSCRLALTSVVATQLEAHMQQASAAGKPMVVDEFNRKRPVSFRNSFLTQAYSTMNAAGSPVVGMAPSAPVPCALW